MVSRIKKDLHIDITEEEINKRIDQKEKHENVHCYYRYTNHLAHLLRLQPAKKTLCTKQF